VEPGATGWNCVVAKEDPAEIVTGEVLIVPAAGFELVTVTLTEFVPALPAARS
jgi:hypothetical protein